ncbi:MAG: Asp-tRNA(Asn)/Glu-tRNA(Gln) amidotransferase subunit GatC [Acidobacteriota bacterium]
MEIIDIDHILKLSKLELSEEEKDTYKHQMQNIINWVRKLEELKCDELDILNLEAFTLLREDKLKQGLERDSALMNAPEREKGFFKVPKVIESK